MVSTGHYLASAAAHSILVQGGNAIDAGIAAGLCLNVVHCEMTMFSGVAPIIVHDARQNRTITYRGVGWWPGAISSDYFMRNHDGNMPYDMTQCIVPAAPDAWLHALMVHGTMTFEEVCRSAMGYAAGGFPAHEFMIETIRANKRPYQWPGLREILLPNDGEPPSVGQTIANPDLARTFQSLVDAERSNAHKGRRAAIQAVRDYIYRGPIAEAVVRLSKSEGGLFELEDFAAFEADQYPPVKIDFGRYTVFGCGPWCQGPTLPLALNILKNFDLKSMGHNSPRYLHTLISALDLAFSDRHHYMGDPSHVAVPIDGMLSAEYGRDRARAISPDRAFARMPGPGAPWDYQSKETAWPGNPVDDLIRYEGVPVPGEDPDYGDKWDNDTSYVACADQEGNLFSATPSDGMGGSCPLVPGLGLTISTRGVQAWTEVNNPNCVAPHKRPRLTPNPGLIFLDGKPWAAFGTPGNDRQPQAMLQVFLNMAVFDMDPQQAIDAPRVATYNHPASSHPHDYHPGVVRCERRIGSGVLKALSDMGHRVTEWPDFTYTAGGVCIAIRDPETGLFMGAADPRRESYAIAL
jgi:gamma-glutamyltranspeptidase/glutathione hydrolase